MIFYRNKPYQLLLFLVISLLLSFCTGPGTKSPNAETIHLYKTQLDSLIQNINKLQADNDQDHARFFADYLKAIRIIDLLPDSSDEKVKAIKSLLFPLFVHGAYHETVRQSKKIIEILNSRNEELTNINVGEVYYRLANANYWIGNFDSTTSFYRQLIFLIKDDDKYDKAAMLNNAGMVWQEIGIPDSAMAYYQFALDLVKECPELAGGLLFEGSILDNIATIYEDRGEFDKTIPIYEKNILRYENTDDYFRWINAGISLMNAELEMQNYPRVKILFEQLSPVMDTLTYPRHQTNDLYLFKVCSRYFSEIGDFRNAYTWHVKATQLSDSVTLKDNVKRDQTIKQLGWLKDTQFEQQLQTEMLEREKQEQQARLRLWIIILIALGATITPTILYYYYKQRIRLHAEKTKSHLSERLLVEEKLKTRNQEKQLLDMELEHKKKDLADMALSLSQKKQQAEELYSRVKQVENSRGKQRQKEIRNLKEELQSQQYVDKKLEHLQQNIDTLSSAFYDKLQKSFPELSKTEVKLSSFIKLNLTTSQIAQLQNITPNSVKMSRYRLKKKLGLDTDQNLDEFLQSF